MTLTKAAFSGLFCYEHLISMLLIVPVLFLLLQVKMSAAIAATLSTHSGFDVACDIINHR